MRLVKVAGIQSGSQAFDLRGSLQKVAELELDDENITRTELRRTKRQIESSYDPYESKPNKTRCPLLLVADYRFFMEMGGSDTKTTINYLVSGVHLRKERETNSSLCDD
jgi:hypothetical protein